MQLDVLVEALIFALVITLLFVVFSIAIYITRNKLQSKIPFFKSRETRNLICVSLSSYILDETGNLIEAPLETIQKGWRRILLEKTHPVQQRELELEVVKRTLDTLIKQEKSPLYNTTLAVIGILIMYLILLLLSLIFPENITTERLKDISMLFITMLVSAGTAIVSRQLSGPSIALCIKDKTGKQRKIPLDSIPDKLIKQLEAKLPGFQEILEEARRIQSESKQETNIPYRIITICAIEIFLATLLILLVFHYYSP